MTFPNVSWRHNEPPGAVVLAPGPGGRDTLLPPAFLSVPPICVEVNMEQRSPTKSEVVAFPPKQARDDTVPVDEAGTAIVLSLREAAAISNEKVERAMALAHRLSVQLREAEDRIAQLHGDLERAESRALRAEGWLKTIQQEIQSTLLESTNRPKLPDAG